MSWTDQRMYTEALQDDIYERNVGKWQEGGKKGPKPKPPQGYDFRQSNDGITTVPRDSNNRPIAPDIGDMLK